jgi:hypothetical protein
MKILTVVGEILFSIFFRQPCTIYGDCIIWLDSWVLKVCNKASLFAACLSEKSIDTSLQRHHQWWFRVMKRNFTTITLFQFGEQVSQTKEACPFIHTSRWCCWGPRLDMWWAMGMSLIYVLFICLFQYELDTWKTTLFNTLPEVSQGIGNHIFLFSLWTKHHQKPWVNGRSSAKIRA